MIATILLFGKKYLMEILLGVAALMVVGGVVYKAQNWCNHACREVTLERDELKSKLATCTESSEREMALYLKERATWQKQVDQQTADVAAAKQTKAKIVDNNRRKFEQIFQERKKNEAKSVERISTQIRPAAVVIAPVALVREYNAAVANGPNASPGGGGGEVWISENPIGVVGEVATFEAVAVAEAIIDNVHKYNELALKCDTLIDTVKELEETYGTPNVGRSAGTPEANGGDVLSGVAWAEVY